MANRRSRTEMFAKQPFLPNLQHGSSPNIHRQSPNCGELSADLSFRAGWLVPAEAKLPIIEYAAGGPQLGRSVHDLLVHVAHAPEQGVAASIEALAAHERAICAIQV